MKWRGRRGRRRVRDEVEGPSWCAARRFTSLRHPDGRLGGRVREDVEHPNLPRVAHHQHLAGAAIGAVEAVLLREGSHQRHRLASRADPLRCDVGQLVDREERTAAGQADRVGTENCRRGRFAKAEVTVVLGRIAVDVVAVGNCDLRDATDFRGRLLAGQRQEGLAKGATNKLWEGALRRLNRVD